MKAVGILLLLEGALALKNAHLDLDSVECTSGVSAACAEQCARNNCYAAKNDGQLNACLRALDTGCSVRMRGTVNVTLEKNLDFCNVASSPPQAAGYVVNVPYLGRWAVMKNPYIGFPRPLASALGAQRCDFLSTELAYAISPTAAIIDKTVCINPTTRASDVAVVYRDMRFPLDKWVYPVSVTEAVNAMFYMPMYQQCYAPAEELTFTVQVEHDIFGGHGVILDRLVKTGTIPLSSLIQPGF